MAELKPQGAKTPDEYFSRLTEDRVPEMQRVRAAILDTFPGIEETMAYGMPTYGFAGGEQLLALASQSGYMNLYLCDLDMASKFGAEIKAAGLPKCGKSCVRFTAKRPIPEGLLQTMLESRK